MFNSITSGKSSCQQMSFLQNSDNFWYIFFVIEHNKVLFQKLGSVSFLKYNDQTAYKHLPPLTNSDMLLSHFPFSCVTFHRTAFDYSLADWDAFCNHQINVP